MGRTGVTYEVVTIAGGADVGEVNAVVEDEEVEGEVMVMAVEVLGLEGKEHVEDVKALMLWNWERNNHERALGLAEQLGCWIMDNCSEEAARRLLDQLKPLLPGQLFRGCAAGSRPKWRPSGKWHRSG